MKPTSFPAVERSNLSRRRLLGASLGAAAAMMGPQRLFAADEERIGRFQQSVCLWCYNSFLQREGMSLDDFAAAVAEIGIQSIELTDPAQWPTLEKHGLICAMTPSHGIPRGLNRVEHHEEILARIRESIDATAEAGYPNVICFSGNREGMDDEEGLANCIAGLKQIAPYAEEKKVTVCLEYLNSINHADYMADSTEWCVKLVHGVGSPRVKVLYDIYHAAMMKEDVLEDIREHHDCWGHYHTGGYPGRNEIDDSQELDYRRIMLAIAETGFRGYVGQEFVPRRADALASLRQAFEICNV